MTAAIATLGRAYLAERRRLPLLCRAAELAVCAAFGSALPDMLAVAGRVL